MKWFLITGILAFSFPVIGYARDLCEVKVLHDVAAMESSDTILKAGKEKSGATEYLIRLDGTASYFCFRGDFCYPEHVLINGNKIKALELQHCKIQNEGKVDLSTKPEIMFGLNVIRSSISPELLRKSDVEDKLSEMGLCVGCSGNAAYNYVKKPGSYCAKLVLETLEGNQESLEMLKDGIPNCD